MIWVGFCYSVFSIVRPSILLGVDLFRFFASWDSTNIDLGGKKKVILKRNKSKQRGSK